MTADASAQLVAEWHACGLLPGDTVLVHSSIKPTLKRLASAGTEISPETLLQSFLAAVGPTGTLLLPLFNFDFTRGVPFDLRSTPSQMGVLSEVARRFPGVVRTGHPIYSFAVLGAQAERFRGVVNFSGYGADSPFAILRGLDGKVAVLDLTDQNSMTFYHHVEEMHEVPYRFHKVFRAPYVDAERQTNERNFGLFVRNLELRVETDVDRMGERLWQLGLYSGQRPGAGCGLRVISARALYDATSDVIEAGRAKDFLYSIGAG
jgi:aminoglycoside 3-N-acetyltransferase